MDAWVLARIAPEALTGCWLWCGTIMKNGYGQGHRPGGGGSRLAHRIVYERLVGPVPPGLQIDHLCRTRACVNPAHLDVVTGSENLRRSPLTGRKLQSHCVHGHALTPENLYVYPMTGRRVGRRSCRTCILQRSAAQYRREMEARWLAV